MGALPLLFQFLLYFAQYHLAFSSSSSSLSSFSSSPHPLCRHDQRSALLQFKHMFTIHSGASSECIGLSGIPSYPKTTSWNEGDATDCCSWDGVTCNRFTGHVIGLDLGCSQLYGTIRPNSSLSQLSHLQLLNLAHNDFNASPIPYAFGSFASLTHLNLSDSVFSGSIPSQICHLSKLISLDLSYAYSELRLEPLHFKIILKNLTRLQELVLGGVNISSALPYSVTNLTSLTALDLSSTGLRGNLPDNVFHLPNLQRLILYENSDLDINLPKSTWRSGSSLTKLDLYDTKLSGELPDSIFNIKSLNYLILSECNLWGSIPISIGNLTQLRKLDLSFNSFDGEVPSTLSNLKQLTSLELSNNHLEGRIPEFLAELPMLQRLDLWGNNFIGGFPVWVANMKPLVYLDISSNHLTGPLPFNLSGLQNLQMLFLDNNFLRGIIPPWLFSLPSLKSLFLSSNLFIGQIPEFQHNLRTSEKLGRLDLSNNRIRGQIPNWVGFIGKASLSYLNLSHNFLTGIKELPWERLQILDLRSNLLQGQLPIPPPSIQYFFISNNNLSGGIPSFICNASSVQILDLSHNKLSGTVPQCLGNFSSDLLVLDLRSNGFKGTLPFVFSKVNNLQSLELNGNQFEGPLPRSLTNCTSLEVLNIGNNKINDTFPNWLGTLPELQVLVLRSNRFHGPINASMTKFPFPKLRIVDLSYNGFTGYLPNLYFEHFQAMKNSTMPDKQYMSDKSDYYHDSLVITMKGFEIEWVRILTIFVAIDFSSNNFSGEIPNVVGKLNSLKVLNFSHNCLTGHIPESLGDLTNLESLDISSNQLSGRIPSQLTSLTFLAVLNLSWNHLDGPIPHGPQFNTFDNGSYVGNPGLCGFPLLKDCEENQTKIQPPVLQQQEDDPYFDGYFWKFVVLGYGCGMTLGLFLGSLMFLIGRPKFFVRLAEKEVPKKVVRLRRMVTDTEGRRK